MSSPPISGWEQKVVDAQRVIDELWRDSKLVGGLVPNRFASYAQILHPIRFDSDIVGWYTTGKRYGIFNSRKPFRGSREAAAYGGTPLFGSPTRNQAESLVPALKMFTQTASECSFCIWEGYGAISGAIVELGKKQSTSRGIGSYVDARIMGPFDRKYLLRRGQIEQSIETGSIVGKTLPDFWWPSDLSWFVASDMDLPVTYVGGSEALITSLQGIEGLDVQLASVRNNAAVDPGLFLGCDR